MGKRGLVDSTCRGCVYIGRILGGAEKWCDYIGATGKRRPCPAGKGCTVRLTGKRPPSIVLPPEKDFAEWYDTWAK